MAHLVLRFMLAVVSPAVLLQIPAARAQPARPDGDKVKAAKSYVDAGLTAQNTGDYDTAITLYTKAYELVPHPVLLFNIAQAHRLAKRDDEAMKFYQEFLVTEPKGPEAQLARDLLAELQKRKAAEAREAEAREAEEARTAKDARETEETREGEEARGREEARKADRPKVRKRKRGGDNGSAGGDVGARMARPLPAARVDAGFAIGGRTLSYTVTGGPTPVAAPPRVDTGGKSVRLEGELYPFALADRGSLLAGLGIFGELDSAFGLSIDVASAGGMPVPISQGHFSIGVCYRLALGKSALSGGVAYARRYYIADRTTLASPTQLDMPDVDYAAISPVIGARTQIASRLSLFAELDVMLVLSAGPIVETENYGAGDAYGIGGNAGIDISLTRQIGLRLAVELNRVNLAFEGTGQMASARGVSAAKDDEIGISTTLAASY